MRRSLSIALAAAAVGLLVAAPVTGHTGHGGIAVAIGGFAYTPSQIDAVVGDALLWTWQGPDTNHSVTGSGPGYSWDTDPGKAPSEIDHARGESGGITLSRPGRYEFHCKVHDSMKGTVNVTADTSGGPAPVDVTAPRVAGLAVVPVRACARRSARCTRPGVRLRFALSERADLIGTIYRVRHGRRRFVRSVDLSGRRGRNDAALRVAGLRPGTYEVAVTAFDDSDNRSRRLRRGFILRPS